MGRGSGKAERLRAAGITPKQAEMWEKLADVPDDEFEHHLTDPTHKPTTSGIIRAARHCRSRSLSSP
jgi:hypothetical protein